MAKRISQGTLAAIVKKSSMIEKLQAEVKAAEQAVLEQLVAGTRIAPGILTARIKQWERRSPSWKTVVERELGEEYASRVLAATKADTYTRLVVEVA